MIDYAWAAGFHEGEGHVALRKNGGLIATISQTNPEPLNKIQSLFGGSIYGPKKTGNNKPVWVWSSNNASATSHYVWCILPWLSESKASDALQKVEYWHNRREVKMLFCSKGHNKDLVGSRKKNRGTSCNKCESDRKKIYYRRSLGGKVR